MGQEETITVTTRLKQVGLPEGTVYRSARQTRLERAPSIRSFQSCVAWAASAGALAVSSNTFEIPEMVF